MDAAEIPDDLLTIKEAARLARNTHMHTVRRWIRQGKLRAYRMVGRVLVSRADVVGLIRPHESPLVARPMTRGEREKRAKAVDEVLRAAGVRRD